MKQSIIVTLLFISHLSLMTGCSRNEVQFEDADQSINKLYATFRKNVDKGRFELAVKYFEELETRYPFSPNSLQARLDLAYAYVLYGRAEQAVSEAEKFIRFNPTHEHVDYAYYIRGIANFGQKKQFLARLFPRHSSDFELTAAHDAFNDFAFLLKNYPNSPYAADARQRMIFLSNTFAEHEIHVAQYYLKKKAWVAAANRANAILQLYPETPSNRDALAILLQAYRNLGLDNAAADTEKTLRLNYPDHPLLTQNQPLNANIE
ncbi:MAG: outer membrane protein assembly factor BamD [Gammaproteobacteria bacterium]|nr:outer membrane protein assembly factor BamD [Gammaproteobacteria bacterium]